MNPYAYFGIVLALIGITLMAAAGVQDDSHKFIVPAAQVGTMMLIGGVVLLALTFILEKLSRCRG